MRANLEKALSLIFGHEGGYSNRSKDVDPGGATMYGVTARKLGEYRMLGRDATPAEVKALPFAEAAEIMASEYARPIRFDDLPAGLDYAMLDYAINSGPAQATKSLQRCLGVRQDGQMGVQTINATRLREATSLINALCEDRLAFMKGLKNWRANSRGWTIRITGKDPLGKWAPQLGVRGNAVALAARPGTRVLTAENDILVDVGGDAKADAAETRVTATASGKGAIATAVGLISGGVGEAKDALTPVVGQGVQFVDYLFTGLTVAGVLALVTGVGLTIYSSVSRIGQGQPR